MARLPFRPPAVLLPLAHAVMVAVLLTFCDALCHVRFGVLVYHRPEHLSLVPGQPTGDVAFGFLQLGLFVALVGHATCRTLPSPGVARALASVAIFALHYLASGLFQDWPMSLYGASLLTWCLHLGLYREGLRRMIGLSVLFAALGPPWEGHAVTQGFFHYVQAATYHVPIWLSALYLHGGIAVAATSAEIASWSRDPREGVEHQRSTREIVRCAEDGGIARRHATGADAARPQDGTWARPEALGYDGGRAAEGPHDAPPSPSRRQS